MNIGLQEIKHFNSIHSNSCFIEFFKINSFNLHLGLFLQQL